MGNTVQLTKNGQPVFPVTDVSLVMGLQDAIKLPPVKVTTLPTASAETAGKMYYVGPDANDEYERYITSATNGSYEWIDLGDTSIPLPSIADNLTTDDANTALSAKQGKVLNEEIEGLEAKMDEMVQPSNCDFAISDENGADIVQFEDGHIRTKKFDSRNQIDSGNTDIFSFSIEDENDNAVLGIKPDGTLKTRAFDSNRVSDDTIKICMDNPIFAVVGDTLQIYYNSILRCSNYKVYDINAVCDIGRSFPRYFEVTPTSGNIGLHPLKISVKDNNGKVIGTKTVSLSVGTPASPLSSLNVFCIGESTTQGGQWVSELQRRLTGTGGTPAGDNLPNINFVGRMAVTFNGVQTHLEATGGYSFASYVSLTTKRCRFNVTNGLAVNISVGDKYSWNGNVFTVQEKNMSNNYFTCDVDDTTFEVYNITGGTLTRVEGGGDATIAFTSARSVGNPFVYDGVLDYPQYINDYCGGTVDIVLANLLINASSPYCEDLEDFAAQFAPMGTFISEMLAAQPNAKIGIIIPPLPSQNGGLGHDYGANNPYGLGQGLKVSFQNMHDAVVEYINENNLKNSVFVVDFTSVCDSEYNFPTEEVPVNPRSSIEEPRGINGLHPLLSGYMQMADAAYRMFINRFC